MRALARGIIQVNAINHIKEFLVLLEGHYIRQLNKSITRKDDITYELKERLGGDEEYRALKYAYENERLLNYLNNKNELNKIVEIGGELVRKENKMYELPRGYLTHYFAPRKYFMGNFLRHFQPQYCRVMGSDYSVNVLVILWLATQVYEIIFSFFARIIS